MKSKKLIGAEKLSRRKFLKKAGAVDLVAPEPWSRHTSPDKSCDWVNHQGTYMKTTT